MPQSPEPVVKHKMDIGVRSSGSPDYRAPENLRWHMPLKNLYTNADAVHSYWTVTMYATDFVATWGFQLLIARRMCGVSVKWRSYSWKPESSYLRPSFRRIMPIANECAAWLRAVTL